MQISEVYTIECEDVLPLWEAVDEIIGLRQQLAEEARRVDPVELFEKVCELSALICKSIEHHILPPTAPGIRQSSIEHKLHAMLHSEYLESGSFR